MYASGTNPDPSTPAPSGGAVGGDWISTALQVGGAIYNASVARKNTKDTIAANRSEAEKAYQREVEMYNNANWYNSPEQQMSRLKGAGLNPNLIYGSGVSGAAGSAQSSMPKYNAPTLQYNYKPVVDIPQMLSMYQDFQMRQAQVNNVKAQTQNIEARTLTEGFRSGLVDMQGQIATQRRAHDEVALPYKAGILANQSQASNFLTENTAADLRKRWMEIQNLSVDEQSKLLNQELMRKQISGQQIENERKEAEVVFAKFRNDWMRMGVTTSDHPLLRIMTRIANEMGLNPMDVFGGN